MHNLSDINKTFIIEPLSITGGSPTLSACTYLYSNEIISCSGNTNIIMGSGYTEFSHDIIVNGVYYSGDTNLYNVIVSAITDNGVYITGATFSGATLILNRGDNVNILAKFTGNTSGDCINNLFIENIYGCSPINLHNDLIPLIDSTIDLGTPIVRFRNINTINGLSTIWTSTTSVTTAALELGLDSLLNVRTITANNSIIQNDILDGNSY